MEWRVGIPPDAVFHPANRLVGQWCASCSGDATSDVESAVRLAGPPWSSAATEGESRLRSASLGQQDKSVFPPAADERSSCSRRLRYSRPP